MTALTVICVVSSTKKTGVTGRKTVLAAVTGTVIVQIMYATEGKLDLGENGCAVSLYLPVTRQVQCWLSAGVLGKEGVAKYANICMPSNRGVHVLESLVHMFTTSDPDKQICVCDTFPVVQALLSYPLCSE